ncbi:hypothetical protein GCM10009122_23710 [Fulvivirga kasyanovii]|uniref:STAS/SEC14 domain-containing protein n=1 Tax=Fulvivirga kasyanovii TaxID=396812 RepID=A0ABW9RJ13_9BACT|nr:hypothetical protein [Fulvivirga kasyanovii]MTI24062.1 hypothetical protein [Fulvivirga kasyanovii]
MKVEITYKYDAKNNIFYKFHYGGITFEDVIDSWNEIIGKNAIPDGTSRFILDYRKAQYLPEIKEIKRLTNFYKAYDHIFADSKMALLMDKPDQVIIPILVDQEVDRISFKPFCTHEGAVTWLKSSEA